MVEVLCILWVLIPDKLDEEEESSWFKSNAFVASLVLFFIAEIGDKTQIATIILGAQYTSLLMVVMGTTLGMLAANVPVVMMGHLAVDKLPLDWIRRVASAVFILLGIYVIIMGLPQASA